MLITQNTEEDQYITRHCCNSWEKPNACRDPVSKDAVNGSLENDHFPSNTKESSKPQNDYEHLHTSQAWEILLKFQAHKWIDLSSGFLAALFYYGKSASHRIFIVYHSSSSAESRHHEHMWLCPSLEEGNSRSLSAPWLPVLLSCSSVQAVRVKEASILSNPPNNTEKVN